MMTKRERSDALPLLRARLACAWRLVESDVSVHGCERDGDGFLRSDGAAPLSDDVVELELFCGQLLAGERGVRSNRRDRVACNTHALELVVTTERFGVDQEGV